MKTYLSPPIFVAFALLSFNVSASVHYVDLNSTNPVPPYTNWDTAAANIQDAVFHAGLNDTVLVTNGIYQYGGYSFAGSNRVYVLNNITVQSVNGPAVTIIKGYQAPGTTNGPNAVRCVYLQNGTTLSGFTLTNGATPYSDMGGGVRCASTNCLVTNCVIIGNASEYGGAGAYYGTLKNCALIGNSAPNMGWGGGANNSTLVNCLLTRNFAGYIGGGAISSTLINCTVVSNVAASYAGSIWGSTLKNCIVYYNSSYYTNADSNSGFSFSNCCVSFPLTGFSGANNFTNPPLFANLSAGDFHLNAASPCINAGDNSFITSGTDLDGNPRVIAGTVDIGAYEFQSPIRYVSVSNTIPVSPYTNWATAATNIQDAIDVASAGDFIVVSNGTYKTGGRAVYGTATNRVTVDKVVTVQSVNGPASTTIAGSFIHGGAVLRCVYLTNGAVLSGFTLTNGGLYSLGDFQREQSGGGAWCEGNSAIISNCVLSGNTAVYGGGGAFQGTLLNCTLTNNIAPRGGGAFSNTLINCTLIKNFAANQNFNTGGGAFCCTLTNCLVVGNQSSGGDGGGAYLSTLTSCVISNNLAGSGKGGGVCFGRINNCLISSNRASSSGGGAYGSTLNNCLIVGNVAGGGGGGSGGGVSLGTLNNCTVVSNTATAGGGGTETSTLNNCIVYYNTAGFSSLGDNYNGTNLNYCCTTPLPTNGLDCITNEPGFVDLANGDFHLHTQSPCINAGNNSYVTNAIDLDGNPRIAGGTVDIGAYEFQSPVSMISYAWLYEYQLPIDTNTDFSDADNDGMNNWQEWIAGTDPTNQLSVLKMLAPAQTNNPSGWAVSWQSVNSRTYYLQRSSNLGAQSAFSTIQSNIVGQAGTTSYTDTNAVGLGPYFYRVGVQY